MAHFLQTVKKYEDTGKPYFHKIEDTKYYTTYVSFDDKHRTLYNKKTYEIFYINQREIGSNRFKKDYISPSR